MVRSSKNEMESELTGTPSSNQAREVYFLSDTVTIGHAIEDRLSPVCVFDE
jgi:DICT domain-containing protein